MNPEANIPDDDVLLTQITSGSETALALLIKKYWKDIYFLCLTYLDRPEIAEEATQDVFVKVWQVRDRLGEMNNFKNYLFIITRNHVFSELRKSLHREPVDLKMYSTDDPEDDHPSPQRQLEFKEYKATVDRAIALLPEKRRLIFRLSRFEGMSYNEIGQKLDIKPSTINDHITQANNFIKTYLRAHIPGVIISLTAVIICLYDK